MTLFSRHLSPEMAEEIWRRRDEFAEGGRPRPVSLPVTVLFLDLRGYTSTSEKLTPIELMDWINEFMGVMADEIMRHGGMVDDYFGDGIKAGFGVPFVHPDGPAADARRAVESRGTWRLGWTA